MESEPQIYRYIEYPSFFADWFDYQKSHRYGFSHRSFCRIAEIDSPNYFQRLISRTRKLTDAYLPKIARGIGLNESEISYLELLAAIERCRDDRERERLTATLAKIRQEHSAGQLTVPMLHYLSHWYYPVIRELIVLEQSPDPSYIVKKIRPAVQGSEVGNAISFLMDNGFITHSDGSFKLTTPILTTGDEVISDIVNRFHRENLILAAEDLTSAPLSQRDVSSLVLPLSQETFLLVKQEIQLFRKKLLQISESGLNSDRVYHLGFQLLPRSNSAQETE